MAQIRTNGINLEYETLGSKSDPAVLLIMGLGGQLTVWQDSFCEGLAAKGFRVIRFDNRDVGKSTHLLDKGVPDVPGMMAKAAAGQPVQAPYSLTDMAGDAVGLLNGLDVDRAHIVGASMGGMITQLVGVHYPAKAKSLVSIMSTTGRRDLPQARPEAIAALMTPPKSDSREDRIAAGVNTWRTIGSPGYAASDAELRARVERDVDRAPDEPSGFARQLAAIIAAPPRYEILRSVRAPTLVIHGADDPLVPLEGGKDTAASIPGAELVIVPGMGHDFTEALTPVMLKHVGDFLLAVEARAG